MANANLITKSEAKAVARKALEIMEATREGASVYRDGSTPKTGYAVGGVVPSLITEGLPTVEELTNFIDANRSKFDDSTVLGLWAEGGLVYSDFSTIVETWEDMARLMSKRAGELAAYDIAGGKDITRADLGL